MSTTQGASSAQAAGRRRLGVSRWSGVIFAVLLVGSLPFLTSTDPYSDSAADYAAYYADESRLSRFGPIAILGVAVGLMAFLWMLARLRTALPRGVAAAAIAPAGAVFAVAFAAAFTTNIAVEWAVSSADGFFYTAVPETALVFDFVASGFLIVMEFSLAVLVWAVALAGRRAEVLPGWLVWVGFILVPLVANGWILFHTPELLAVLWLAAVTAIMPVRD